MGIAQRTTAGANTGKNTRMPFPEICLRNSTCVASLRVVCVGRNGCMESDIVVVGFPDALTSCTTQTHPTSKQPKYTDTFVALTSSSTVVLSRRYIIPVRSLRY